MIRRKVRTAAASVAVIAGALTLFAACDWGVKAAEPSAPEQGAAAERRVIERYRFSGKNGQVNKWLWRSQFTKETQQYLDPKYVGTDVVLETSIWAVDDARTARDQFEAAGIRTWDYTETSNPFRDCHFKFNMLDVTALKVV